LSLTNIPTKEREDFTAIGRSINLASRVESKATAYQIIVSSHTRERIQNQFSVETLMVKVGEEIKAFEYEREYYKVLGRLI
jgi:class 3 adenylate cyclase